MLAKITAPTQLYFNSRLLEIECDISNGLPSLVIVGLGDKAVDEAKERVRSAIKNSGLVLPPKRITLNLAPADLPKDGTSFDLPIAVAVLTSTSQIEQPENCLFAGELALNGDLRPVRGILPSVQAALKHGIKEVFVPEINAAEAALISEATVYPVKSLRQLYLHLTSEAKIVSYSPSTISIDEKITNDLESIYGQERAKRALEIAAAGNHNLLLLGPPGSGKTMLAKALLGILPNPSADEIIEINQVHSLAGTLKNGQIITRRPFRSPHHTASNIALIGGGNFPRPGEISLSHCGVLFLDELPEFARNVIEVLRQPLEDQQVSIARASGTVSFPAKFMLIATQNPCPCGYAGDQLKECLCSPNQVYQYSRKVSGPLLDRIDLTVEVPRIDPKNLTQGQTGENSLIVAQRVQKARNIQALRFGKSRVNSEMTNQEIKQFCDLDPDAQALAGQALAKLNLSARAYMRMLKVARTIADLEACQNIAVHHLSEALQYRDR